MEPSPRLVRGLAGPARRGGACADRRQRPARLAPATTLGARTVGRLVENRFAARRRISVFRFPFLIRRHRKPNWSTMSEEQLLQGSCHCGAVRLTLPSAPEKATKCNCSICRRLGGLWAYYEFGTVRIEGHPENTAEYIWGDKTLRNVRCKTCGCATHWEPLVPEPGGKHGVNLNNFDPRLQESVQVRRFDGADTWKFID